MKRKAISWKTKCAAALLDAQLVRERFGLYPGRWYDDAKQMTEDQFLSLFQWDHNILHSTEHDDRDRYWNLAPLFITEHRQKTKKDAAIVAKSRRIRKQLAESSNDIHEVLAERPGLAGHGGAWQGLARQGKARIRSRGFSKTRSRGFDGKVRERRK